MKQTAAFSPPLIKHCSKLPALLQITTSSAFNNLFSIALLTYYLPGSQHSYLYAVSLQLHIPMFMLPLLCCLLTRVHYLLKQERCTRIKHVSPVAASRVEPINGGQRWICAAGEQPAVFMRACASPWMKNGLQPG